MMAWVPIARPITALVTGKSMARRMMKGTERRKLMATPSTVLNRGMGLMPPEAVTTSSMPRGMPMR